MRKRILAAGLTVLTLLFTFWSCQSGGSKVINPEFGKYIQAYTSGSIHNSSEIEIQLTQDVPNVEIGAEIEKDLFNFSPKVKGKAYWKDNHTVVFTPEKDALKPGTKYDAWFKLGKVLSVEKKFEEFYFDFSIPEQSYSLSLEPYYPIRETDLRWNAVQGRLILSNSADIENIEKMFSVEGKQTGKTKVKITPTQNSGYYNVQIDSLYRSEEEALTYKVKLNGGEIKSDKNEELEINIPALPEFNVVNAEITYDPQECIKITFSDPISQKQNILGLITLNTNKSYSYEINKNTIKIYTDAKAEDQVELKIFKEIKNSMNKPLGENKVYSLTFQKHEPQIKFTSTANILPNAGKLIVPFQAVGLWAVDISVVKIYENNILYYLQTNDFGGNNELKRFGKLMMKKRIRLDKDPSTQLNQWNTFPLDLSELIEKDPGAIYQISFNMKQEYSTYPCEDGEVVNRDAALAKFEEEISEGEMSYWETPDYYYYDDMDWSEYDWKDREDPCTPSYYMNRKVECFALASSIGITAKQGTADNVFVALTNIATTEPIYDAAVDIYNYQMQVIGSSRTDSEGFAMIDYKGGVPFAVVARSNTDKGYLKITQNSSLSLSNFDVSGQSLDKGLKGYIYGERGVWRPGDSIYVTFILEDREQRIPEDHPASIELYNPRGQLYKTYVSSGAKNGFYPFRMATDEDAMTGGWRANVKIGGTNFSQRLKIETVKPNRLKVRLKAGDIIEASAGEFTSTISSQWLHGAPASNLKAKVEMTLSQGYYPFEGYSEYTFNNPASNFSTDSYELFDGALDDQGNATFKANLPQAENAPGMLKANFISRVFETGGDASIYTQVVPFSPFSSYVGLKTPKPNSGRWLETDADYSLDIVTLKPNGKLTDQQDLNVKIYKVSWSWWWNTSYESLSSYVNNTSTEVMLNKDFSTKGGKAKINFKIEYPNWGRYLVMVTDKDSGHKTGQIIYVDWPEYRGRSDKTDPSGLTMLSFSTDKEKYDVGDNVTVILPKSSEGRALVTIEDGSRILAKTWVKTSAKEDTKHVFKVTKEMAPNFYIFASLFQPHGQTNNDLPIRMYGVLNINVDNKETILKPVISMPNELRPEKEYTIAVSEENKKEMTYTLAVVDEGLLDLTAFRTPNAWSDFYARQALGVRTWDMYDYIVGALAGKMGPLLSIGGDEALKPADETMKRFKPVVKYIGPFVLGSGKTNKHTLTMPAYFGSVRVMVVAGDKQTGAYGSAEKAVPVNNPLMVISTLPRVAGPGEEIMLPVNVFAMNDKVKDVDVSVKSSGIFELVGSKSQQVTFSGKGDKTLFFKVKVANKIGHEKVEITAKGSGETVTETIDIEIRNPNPPILMMSDALVEAGKTVDLKIDIDAPAPKDWVKLEVSRMPGLDLNRTLKYLFDYPHGCTEQITSKAFPALYVQKFREFSSREQEVMKSNVRSTISQLGSRQISNGGFTYWPGGSYANEWASTYATHFLVEAERAGYNVPASVKSKALNNLKVASLQWNDSPLYSTYYTYTMSPLQQAYRLYVLALANQPEFGAMNRLKEKSGLDVQARWRLAATYAIAGRKDAANEILQGASSAIQTYSFSNDTYGSYGRDLAMIIETLVLQDKTKEAVRMAEQLAKEVSNSYYLTTQTSAYSLIALSKLADKLGSATIKYEWELNGAKQKADNTNKVYKEIEIEPKNAINVKFTNVGEGVIYVRLAGMAQPLVDKEPAKNDGIGIEVKYVDTDNRPIDISTLKQGKEFYALVTLRNTTSRFLSDLILSQIFPSGWEIFNTRLYGGESSTVAQSSSYNYLDIRDDRVYTYFNLSSTATKVFRVRLQAAYRGKYYLPAIACEAMYNPADQSKTTGRWVEVVE